MPVALTTRTARVAAAADILLSKQTADRQKDRDMLPALRAAFEKTGSQAGSDRAAIAERWLPGP